MADTPKLLGTVVPHGLRRQLVDVAVDVTVERKRGRVDREANKSDKEEGTPNVNQCRDINSTENNVPVAQGGEGDIRTRGIDNLQARVPHERIAARGLGIVHEHSVLLGCEEVDLELYQRQNRMWSARPR